MDQKLQDQISKLQNNDALIRQLMNSPDGQKLLQLLTQDGGQNLRRATDAAGHGNTSDIVRMLAQLMQSKDGAALIARLKGQLPK